MIFLLLSVFYFCGNMIEFFLYLFIFFPIFRVFFLSLLNSIKFVFAHIYWIINVLNFHLLFLNIFEDSFNCFSILRNQFFQIYFMFLAKRFIDFFSLFINCLLNISKSFFYIFYTAFKVDYFQTFRHNISHGLFFLF